MSRTSPLASARTKPRARPEPYEFGDLSAFGYDDSTDGRDRALAILRRLEPSDVRGVRKVRLGREGDGGYVMLDDFEGIVAAYSLGISDDVSWDIDVARRGIDVFQYDHTVPGPPEPHPRFHFRRCGIAGIDRAAGPFRALPALMKENGHVATGRSPGRDLLLKCDIEAAEWEALAVLEPHHLRLFRQIVVEFHGLRDLHRAEFAAIAGPVLAALTTDHRVVHVHGNNHAAYAITGGLPVPSVLEVTFACRDAKVFTRPRRPFPTPLDRPNNNARADHALGFFRF